MSKEAERSELHKTIWRIANDLRGSVDGWDFKSYVLGMLFYRFISENLTAYLNEQERRAGNPDFDYARLGAEEAAYGMAETVNEKGFFVFPADLFVNVRARARHDANLNETLSRVFTNIEASAKGAAKEWADQTLADLRTRSPMSLAITFRHIRDARALDLRETLIQDFRLAWRCLDASDFTEGVRAALIDKDHAPHWMPSRFEDIDEAAVDRYFKPLGADDLPLLTREEMQAARV